MNWFVLALIPQILWAISNYIDRHLVAQFFRGSAGILALLCVMNVLTFFVCFGVYMFDPNVLQLGFWLVILTLFAGINGLLASALYLWILQTEPPSLVIPLYQMSPVFAYFWGYVLLGEVLSAHKILAGMVILLGGIFTSIDLDHPHKKIKTNVLLFIFGSAFLWNLSAVLFKYVSFESNYTSALFWNYLGYFLGGIGIFFCSSRARKHLRSVFAKHALKFLSYNVINEIFGLGGGVLLYYVFLLAPVALVSVVVGFQSFFVFLIGLLLTISFPHVWKEDLRSKIILQKLIGLAIMLLGSYFLNT